MNEIIRNLLAQITELEDELHKAIQVQQVELRYQIKGTRVRFEKSIREAHRKFKTGYIRWLRQSQPRNVISAPFIYSMIFPVVLLDLWVSLYQRICFPLYQMPKVQRSMYIIVDRHHLAYLNIFEKLNCIYCGYVGGVFSYVREIAARTEQYWCPLKHARKVLDPHRRYARFADYGNAEGYQELIEQLRDKLRTEQNPSGVDIG